MSKIIRAMTKDGSAFCASIDSTEIVREAMKIHSLSPVGAIAAGRLITATSLMGSVMKNERDVITVTVKGNGLGGTLSAISDYNGNVRCKIENPAADTAWVPEFVGKHGFLQVIKDLGLKEPYTSNIPISTGEIIHELQEYYDASEQIPTIFLLGVQVGDERENFAVKAAGGFFVQIIPPFKDTTITALENNVAKLQNITGLLQKGISAEKIALEVLGGLSPEVLDSWDVRYRCTCSKEKTFEILASLSEKERQNLAKSEVEVCCPYCNKKYVFGISDLASLR
jgi:molecular chaperone Hsp33